MNWCSYDENGKLINVGTAPSTAVLVDFSHMPGKVIFNVPFEVKLDRHYVKEGQIMSRPEQPIKLEGMKLKGVSASAKIEIEGVIYECDGSDIELEFNHPGTYLIKVRDWPSLDWSVEIENQA